MTKNYLKKQLNKLLIHRAGIIICFMLYLLMLTVNYASAQIDPSEYPPGHPNVTVSALQQLKTFPTPRFKQGNAMLPNFNWMDPVYFGGRFQSGVSDAQAVTNSVDIQTELAKNFNYYVLVSWSADNFNTAWKNLANANPQYKVGLVTLRAQTRGSNPSCAMWSQTYPNDHYMQTSTGQFIDAGGNNSSDKTWRPTAPVADYNIDGQVAKGFLNSALSGLTRPVDMVNEDGEVYPIMENNALQKDPVVTAAKNASGLDWENYYAKQVRLVDNGYSSQFMSISALSSAKYTEYRLDGHRDYQLRWEQTKFMNSQINGNYYATSDFYVRWPNNWKDWSGPWHGLKWMTQSRHFEIAAGDKLFSPFIAAGYDANPENDVRPAQWLGLLKLLGMYGAEFYYTGYFNEQGNYNPPNPPPYDPKGYAWQAVTPTYSQAITSRYEDILRNGSLLPGDMTDNSNSTGPIPYYQFNTGATNKIVAIRKLDAANKYAITGTIQNSSNTIGSTPLIDDASITLNGQNLKFKVRRQGSTYIYDNTNASSPVFYQLDEWHESSHPSYWSKDFNLEAELYDNTSATYSIKTSVPAGTAAGDYRSFTSYITFPDAQSTFTPIEYVFQPRDAANTTYYVWVKARTRVSGTSTGFDVSVDNANQKSIGCVSDTNWTWFRLDACTQQVIKFSNLTLTNHTLRLMPVNSKLEIDKIILTTSSTMTQSPAASACSSTTATVTASGPLSFCQGGSVVLTSSAGSSYLWSPGGQTSQSITVTTAGTYSVAVGTGTSCSATSSPQVVTIISAPNATITANGATTFCQGGSVVLSASSGSSYLWTPGGATTQSITVTSAGSYTVKVTVSGGCSATSAPTVVTVTSGSTATITPSGATTFCQGGNVTLTANSGSGYLWTPGNQTTQSITVSSAGSYTVRVTASGGCSATSSPTVVSVNANPSAIITPSGATTFCQGGNVTLSANSASSYLWTPGNQTTQSISVSVSGSYTVRTTNSNGCSSTSSPQSVTVNVPVVPTITPNGPTTIDQGQTVTLTASAGASYLWSPGGQTTQSITVGTANDYRVTVTYSNGCSAISAVTSVIVNVNTTPVTITLNGANSICRGDSVLLSATSGFTYLWMPGLQTSQSIYVKDGGIYTVQASNGTSAQVNIIVNEKPMVPSITTTYIPNSAYQLTAYEPSAVSYLWSNGMTTQTITMVSAGTVSVRAVGSSGCISALQSMTVTNPVAQPCAKATMLTSFNIIDVAANISWNPAVTADSFVVSYTVPGSGIYGYITVPGNVTTTKVQGLTPGQTYQWTVKTFCGNGFQASSAVQFTTLSAPLNCGATPINLSTSNVTGHSARLNWYNTSAQQFTVKYKITGTTSYMFKTVNAIGNPDGSLLINLLPNTTYEWSVQSICNSSLSLYSPVIMFTTIDACAAINTPLKEINVTHNTALIGWDPAIVADTFKIRFAIQGTVDYKRRTVLGIPNPGSVLLDYLQPDTYYVVQARTKCASGDRSEWTPELVIHTHPAPTPRLSEGDPMQLNVYPNPAHEKITYAFVADQSSEYTVMLTDMSGRELFRTVRAAYEGLNGADLDVSKYANGIYMLTLQQGPATSRFKFSVH